MQQSLRKNVCKNKGCLLQMRTSSLYMEMNNILNGSNNCIAAFSLDVTIYNHTTLQKTRIFFGCTYVGEKYKFDKQITTPILVV